MLNRTSPLPMYHQVKSQIVDMIKNGELGVGDRVYSENEICQRYGVSNITAKRVLNELAHEGYITRKPGRGSFVTQTNPISHMLSHFYSFTEELRRKGMSPSSELIKLGWETPPPKGVKFLELEEGEKALLVMRKRFANEDLITLDHSYLKCSACEHITEEALGGKSLYEILRENSVFPDRALESFDAIAIGKEPAKLMGIASGAAVLCIHRCTYSENQPIEYNYRYYMPGRILYNIELDMGGPRE